MKIKEMIYFFSEQNSLKKYSEFKVSNVFEVECSKSIPNPRKAFGILSKSGYTYNDLFFFWS